jgi:tetratricopeptide (TPR) repeat protein
MKYVLLLGFTVSLVTYTNVAEAKTPTEVNSISQAATVEIRLSDSVGSGVLIHRQENLYTLVTNRHVVCGNVLCTKLPANSKYNLSLVDISTGSPIKQQHQVSVKAVKLLGKNLDLAIIQFRSDRNYPVAAIAEPNSLKVDDVVYTAGFPYAQPGFYFDIGKTIAVVNKRLNGDSGGYSIIYDASTLPGMSGGGVFNENGQLVAIHGIGDRYQVGTETSNDFKVGNKIGFNRGIPIRWVIQSLKELGIALEGSDLINGRQDIQDPTTADEHFMIGFNKFVSPGDNVVAGKRQAIQEFSKAIKLNPRYTSSYFVRGYTYTQLEDLELAIKDYSKTIELDPKHVEAYISRGNLRYVQKDLIGAITDYDQAIILNPQSYNAYNNRGNVKAQQNNLEEALADYTKAILLNSKYAEAYYNRGNLKDRQNDLAGARSDYDQAIILNPQDASTYINRGLVKEKLHDVAGAMADYNQAIVLNPKYAEAYNNRGVLKAEQNDLVGAMADYNRAITINPKYAVPYNNRANLKADQNDLSGALADYNQAIALNPTLDYPYFNRGNLKRAMNDFPGALADYSQAIVINPENASAYYNRGTLKKQLNDREGAIEDLRRSLNLYRKQGQNKNVEDAIRQLRRLGVTE